MAQSYQASPHGNSLLDSGLTRDFESLQRLCHLSPLPIIAGMLARRNSGSSMLIDSGSGCSNFCTQGPRLRTAGLCGRLDPGTPRPEGRRGKPLAKVAGFFE